MILKIVREGLGRIIILADTLTRPNKIQRSAEHQAQVDKKAQGITLYQFYACPFCIKTRRAIRRLNIHIETRNAQIPGQHRNDLENLGGKIKAPCLRIQRDGQDKWMYESNDIIAFLEQQFSTAA